MHPTTTTGGRWAFPVGQLATASPCAPTLPACLREQRMHRQRLPHPDANSLAVSMRRKERHLNGTVLEAAFQRPALLITGSLNALQVAPDR